MRYQHYTVEDLVLDEFFQKWIYAPDEETNLYWQEFLALYPHRHKVLEEARLFLRDMRSKESLLAEDVPEATIEDIKMRFNEALNKQVRDTTFVTVQSGKSGGRPARIFYLAAASVIFVASLLGVLLSTNDIEVRVLEELSLEQETTNGGLRHMVLSDGTEVWLNAGSSLKYPGDFTKKERREVYLEGEAFFDVYENRDKPFIVRTSGVSISVLGTTFNVKSYAKDHVVETTLVSGKVTISSDEVDSLSVTLQPNQQALFSKESRKIELKDLHDTGSLTEWRNGWMIFDDEPFSKIQQRLERWYNVTIHVEDPRSLLCTFSGKFKDKTLEEVLEIFSHTVPIRYHIDGTRVFIQGQLCKY